MKKLSILILALLVAGFVYADTTTTVTNRGQVITVKTLGNAATDAANLDVFQDMSTYAAKPGQAGKIVRWYDFSKQGGAMGTHKLLPEVAIPDNALIRNGYVFNVTAMTSATDNTATHAITLNTTGDIRAASTNLVTTGISAVLPVGTAASAVQATAERYLSTVIATEAVTAGKFMVVLDYDLAP